MGYSTHFKGELTFTSDITVSQLKKLNTILGEDCRNHTGWDTTKNRYLTYIDLELTPSMDGLKWNGSENTYMMEELVNVVIRQMRMEFPTFGLVGKMLAQGDDVGDIWHLYIGEDGFAHRKELLKNNEQITCPHCNKTFSKE